LNSKSELEVQGGKNKARNCRFRLHASNLTGCWADRSKP